VIISAAEKSKIFGPLQAQFFAHIDERRVEAVTSEITLAECLVKPFADKDIFAVESYISLLGGLPRFPVIPISRQILLSAAQLRAETRLKLPDAIHLATAKWAGCSAFVTNDRQIKGGDGVRIIWWDQLSEADYL
jgi:predicted nucleic acid-binding protein